MSVEIVVTLGPASPGSSDVAALCTAGATHARLNSSHLDKGSFESLVDIALEGGFAADRIVVDLQGAKVRLGHLAYDLEVFPGTEVWLGADPSGESPALPVDSAAFLAALEPWDRLRVDDGRLEMLVLENRDGRVKVRVLIAGTLRSRKGLARVGRPPFSPVGLLARDRAFIDASLGRGIRSFAVSYSNDPAFLDAVRQEMPQGVRLIAKIEHPLAVERLDRIASVSDALWLCRGDLGAEVGLARLPAMQERVLASTLPVPLLVAGQVLHHMTRSPRPTRSEVCHVWDLLRRGVAGFVLSDETAQGPYGVEAVGWVAAIAREAKGLL